MPKAVRVYVRWIDALNRIIGRCAMWMVLVMMGLLLFSSITRVSTGVSYIWVVEMAQFLMAAYYTLGGGYSVQLGSHVRMDLLYGRWSPRRRALTDAVTAFFLLFYLVVLLMGGISSTGYALSYGQENYTAWAPPLWPIKLAMTVGIALMLLQIVAMFFKDLARARGESMA